MNKYYIYTHDDTTRLKYHSTAVCNDAHEPFLNHIKNLKSTFPQIAIASPEHVVGCHVDDLDMIENEVTYVSFSDCGLLHHIIVRMA